jgi:Reverse transcriptase (RNA-dependent DNA polymerase)
MKRQLMEQGRKCIKCKWVFDIKRDGTFRARLVACGYSQILGVDFKESFSPVTNDVVFCIILICQIMWKLIAVLADVEIAFLHGDLNETIYMECPEGLYHDNDEVVVLLKSMYGLVQAARQFNQKYSKMLKDIGFTQSCAEPFLFFKKGSDHMIIMAIHVDDSYIIGKKESIARVKQQIETNGLKWKMTEDPKYYLSC